ncbi:MAG: hypothetical protein KC635_21810, partial [Myxococcales bacterium]|nr:hypothetical protein [Myxococcales bacterium]
MRSPRSLLALLALALAVPLAAPAARAESWCAYPLWVHEWGVHVFASDGAPAKVDPLPGYFHRPSQRRGGAPAGPVRGLPADNGVRTLPVVHFYSAGSLSSPIPVGLEVGFRDGAASAWFPEVDRLEPAVRANGPAAVAGRQALLAARAAREGRYDPKLGALPPDPTRQLVWDRLELTRAPVAKPAASGGAAWVDEVRGFGDALWVNARGESERFAFYEADTAEKTPLALGRGDTFGPGRRHYVLVNRGAHAVHDVLFVHREAGRVYVFAAPMIPAGKSAGFLVEDHLVAPADVEAATAGQLRRWLVDPKTPAAPKDYRWDHDDCVMMRDPAVPVEAAAGYRLYASEVEAILHAWGPRFFGQDGTTVVYREDERLLDAVMPISVYTDMFNFVVLNRAGLAVWEHV